MKPSLNMNLSQITDTEYAPYFKTYLSKVDESDLIEELEISQHRFIHFVRDIPMDRHDYRYAPGKWAIKDIIQHLIDAERIFSYRALRFARRDLMPLPGFDENDYADVAGGNDRSLQELLTEFSIVREATLCLYKSFSDETLQCRGIASGHETSVRAIGFIIIGHQNHHEQVFRERYL